MNITKDILKDRLVHGGRAFCGLKMPGKPFDFEAVLRRWLWGGWPRIFGRHMALFALSCQALKLQSCDRVNALGHSRELGSKPPTKALKYSGP